MVGKMRTSPREKAASLIGAAKCALDVPTKLENLYQLKEDWFENDPVLVSEFLLCLFEFQSDRFSPVRRFITLIIGEIGLMHMEVLPEVVPFFTSIMQDGAPAVARQAITCGIDLFRCTFEKVAIQGLYSSELDDSLESAWDSMLKFKEQIYSIAFQGSDSTRLLALKFIETIILLYTPDPNGSSEPPPDQACEVTSLQFNISWLRGGHPLLNVGNLSVEASQSLGLLLDQLRFPTVKSISNSMIIVLIKSLATIATKRPAFYGRILPVLLGLDPSSTTVKGIRISAAHYALKKAFISCLDCVHPAALPWRERLVSALEELKTGKLGAQACHQDFKMNGDLEVGEDETEIKEEKPLTKTCDVVQCDVRKKRDSCDSEGNDVSGKRIRQSPVVSEELIAKESSKEPIGVHDNNACEVSGDKQDPHSAPVRQLVDMFGALVAQGERAAGSLEILISSISADLLAEVVIANMQHLPCNQTVVAGDEESIGNLSALESDNHVKQPSALLAEIFSLSSAIPQIASVLSIQQSGVMMRALGKQEHDATILAASDVMFDGMNYADAEALMPTGGVLVSSDIDQPKVEVSLAIASEIHDKGNLENEIPGLETAGPSQGLLHETVMAASLAHTDYENTSQNPVASVPSVSVDKSEELSPKSISTDANSLIISTATSVTLSNQIVFPKMSAPVVSLADEQKDNLQLWAFTRIVEAYKQIVVSGGADVQFSLLSYLGVELPLDLDPWKVLQKHILSDYVKNEGHELTLRVLYKLFGEAEERDFFSSTTAASVYEMFLLTVVETLRDSFPSSDKSFTKLLGEVPYLPKSIFKFLEELCSPGQCPKVDKDTSSGDRVTQGLSAVWSLILLRPPVREACLKIALQSAVHHMEEVRMKAIRLVANKLYPLSSIAQQIEDFAKESLLSVLKSSDTLEKATADAIDVTTKKNSDLGKPIDEHPSVSVNIGDISETQQPCTPESVLSSSISDAQRCMALYFALCTKKHSLFRQVFVIYGSASEAVKQAINRHIPILVRTIGSSPELLEIISDPPAGGEELLLQVICTLTDGTIPSSELIHTIRKSFESKLKNAEILVPVLPFLSKDEILPVFPQLVGLPIGKFQDALSRMLQGSSTSDPYLTPAEVLIAIHGIDPDRDRIPLKKVTDACNACFEQRHIFTQQVLAKVLNQLVEQIPLPLLFMRTVLQAIGAYPALVDFIMEILSRLVSKQIWKYPKLWVGFLKCTQLTKPQSFSVLLQLPPAQLENALNKIPALKSPLSAHASQPDLRSTLPRSVLTVLGVVAESQTSLQSQASQVQTAETSNAETTQPAEKTGESSEVDTKS